MTPHDKIAAVVAGASGGFTVFGVAIADINLFLQAVAFMAAIFSGFGAGLYYTVKAYLAILEYLRKRRGHR